MSVSSRGSSIDTLGVIKAAQGKVTDPKAGEILLDAWTRAGKVIALRLRDNKATMIQQFGTFTRGHRGEPVFQLVPKFATLARCVEVSRQLAPANVPVSALSPFAVGTIREPRLDKLVVADAITAVVRATIELIAAGKRVSLELAPLGTFKASKRKGQLQIGVSFAFAKKGEKLSTARLVPKKSSSKADGARQPTPTRQPTPRRKPGTASGSRSRRPASGAGVGVGAGSKSKPRPSSSRPSQRRSSKPASKRKSSGSRRTGGWTDPDFPPNERSLCHDWKNCPGPQEVWRGFVWRRAHEFCDDGVPVLFEGGISPMDVYQGLLGDCYFQCALSALAEFPHRVKRLFVSESAGDKVVVRWWQNGEPIEVVLDDWFPCEPDTGEPCFSRCKGSELWVAYLEKAWAKVHGSYQQINGGNTTEVLSAFTGAPEKVFMTQGKEATKEALQKCWEEMLEAEKLNFVITGSVPDYSTVDLEHTVGIIEDHAYAILSCHELRGGVRLCKLRNPWGKVEWKGAWCDSSPLWTPELKAELGWSDADDGIFFMTFEDLIKYINEIGIVRLHDRNSYKWLQLPHLSPGKVCGVEVEFKRKTKGSFEMHQPTRRCYMGRAAENFKYEGLHFKIVKLGPAKFVDEAIPLRTGSVHKFHKFDAGRYLIMCTGGLTSRRKLILSFYGSSSPTMTLSNKSEAQIYKLMTKVFADDTLATGDTKMDFAGAPGLAGVRKTYESGMCMVYTNNSRRTVLEEKLEVDLNNSHIIGWDRNSAVKIKLAPGQTEVVLLQVFSPGDLWGASYTRHLNIEDKA